MAIYDQIISPQKNRSVIAMKVIEIIQNEISLAHPEIHKTRLNILFTFVPSGLKAHSYLPWKRIKIVFKYRTKT